MGQSRCSAWKKYGERTRSCLAGCVRRRRFPGRSSRAARRRGRGQAREPSADRRLQGARRPDLCRRADQARAEGAGVCFGDSRQSRPESRLRWPARRTRGDDLRAGGNSIEKNAAMRALGAELDRVTDATFRPRGRRRCGSPTSAGPHMVPSFHRDLALGVATYALELLDDRPDLDVLYVPIGQGSGVCGCIAARDALGLKTDIVGVQSAEAPAYALSFAAGHAVRGPTAPTRYADGMATRVPDEEALAVIVKGARADRARQRRGDRRGDPRLLDRYAQSRRGRRRSGRSQPRCRSDRVSTGARSGSCCPGATSTSISSGVGSIAELDAAAA